MFWCAAQEWMFSCCVVYSILILPVYISPPKKGITSQWTSIRTPFLSKGLRKKKTCEKIVQVKISSKNGATPFFSEVLRTIPPSSIDIGLDSWHLQWAPGGRKRRVLRHQSGPLIRYKWSYNPYKWPKIYG